MKFKRCSRIMIHLIIFNGIGLLFLRIIPYPVTIGIHILYFILSLLLVIGYEWLESKGLVSPYWFKS